MGSVFGPTCTDGDRMGCGIDFNTDCGSGYVNVFFTKNGKQVRRGNEGVGEEEKRLRRREGRGEGEERVSEENNTKGRWKRGEREEGTEEKEEWKGQLLDTT